MVRGSWDESATNRSGHVMSRHFMSYACMFVCKICVSVRVSVCVALLA